MREREPEYLQQENREGDFVIAHMGYEYDTLMSMLQTSVSKHLMDEHYTLIWANDFYYRMIQYPREEYESLFHNRPDLYYPYHGYRDEWEKIVAAVTQMLAGGRSGYSLTTRMPVKSGGHIWVRFVATFTNEYINDCRVSYTSITNIDDLVRVQQDQDITYNSLPGFAARFRFKRNHEIDVWDSNDQFNGFFGSPEDCGAFQALLKRELKANERAVVEHRRKIERGDPVRMLLKLHGKDGQTAWLQTQGECVDWMGGDPVYLFIFIDITDLTDLKEMQRELEEQAQQLREALALAESATRAKSDFLSHMSHDIRTPMNAIIGMTEIASNHLGDTKKVSDCLDKITLSSKHLLGLINDILDMSKIESGKMVLSDDVVSLAEVMENTVAIIQPSIKERRQKFSIRLRGIHHEYVSSDALRLRQILINILSNASQFTPAGGSVTREVEERELLSSGFADYRFTISDTGVGMKPEFLSRIFDAFIRAQDSRTDKTEGSGLGMAITKKMVDLLGGTIAVESRVGQGSAFTVCLPFRIVDAPGDEAPGPSDLCGLRILISDDDGMVREYTVEALRELGVEGEWADSGKKAVEMARAAKEAGRPYDAVILDWQMPGQDGITTARQIRGEFGPGLPILIFSSYDWTDIMDEAAAAGVDGFLSKPVFPSTLYRGLRRYVLRQLPEALEQPQSWDFSGRRFLLVEDNDINREVAAMLLADLGAEVECAGDGREGTGRFRASPAGYYDLILMDIQMPVMDGYAAARLIRAMPRGDAASIPIVAMTADAFVEDIAAAWEAGMNGHLAKPLDITVMKREISKLLTSE